MPKSKAGIFDFFSDEKFQKICGLTFIVAAIFLLIAFTSYLTTWKTDQDKIFRFSWGVLVASDVEIANSLGRLGAIVSHTFIFNLLGLPSFLIALWLLGAGINLALRRDLIPVKRFVVPGLIAGTWLAIALSFVTDSSGFPWGGSVGSGLSDWFTAFTGTAGMTLLLLFGATVFAVYYFNLSFRLPEFGKKAPAPATPGFDMVDENLNIMPFRESPQPAVSPGPEPENEPSFETVDTPAAVEEEPGEIAFDIEETHEEAMADRGSLHTNYDPTLDLPDYKYPETEILEDYGSGSKVEVNQRELEQNKNQIIETLNNYSIKISAIKATIGPTVTLYEIVPAAGVRISRIRNLEDDIALSLSALGIRIIAPIPGKGTIGIEVPNLNKEIVSMRSLLGSEKFQSASMDLPIALGKNIANEIFITDLARMPHLLMAGATGQGKSVGLNAILTSLLYKKHPSQLKLVLIDPKKVELSLYKRIEKHFLARLPDSEESIITDTRKVVNTLNSLVIELEERYNLLKEAHVRNIKEYNLKFVERALNPEKGHRFLPYIVLVIDEFADLMMTAGKEIETPITRLAQMARAIGIHLVIATQRPSVNIITGTIKANFPVRVAFKVTSKIDSRTILDTGGAEQLVGRGDMLLSLGGDIVRLQCPFVDTPEVERVCEFIGEQRGYSEAFKLPEVIEEKEEGVVGTDEQDEYFEEAAQIVVQHQQGSTSLLQRRLKLGYNRAGRIIDQLQAAKIVGPPEGSKAREVLFNDLVQLEQYLQEFRETKES